MGCLESLPYEVLLSKISFKESREFLSRYQEKYDIEPGYRMFDLNIIGVPPIRVAVDGNALIFPFTKPCHGTFLIRVPEATEEIERLRNRK
ncbi:DUF1894 domain-containing protein [Methanospirillum sp. J.3.6.1-F.2.7.3]|jgi:hypothetical protein|uniref:DUF1894 domain-containing protein n=2 Tax=Methanospirillum TaxID=2202 RepID=A0A8E7B350_9EURY|nr:MULTISPECIES: DUF1894 domain-containing protein [Methanospirillum]MDX8549718.1 DUF1894 domain-containing protein [Methanospirillum hungatei]QVV89643.1 DUF1894 domain-containing protein [Methanospirillum sp. J.3.6.1-F.2.7.3]QXO96066.1 DUF1894 domain-containing protein [Methanospirillum hungatei]